MPIFHDIVEGKANSIPDFKSASEARAWYAKQSRGTRSLLDSQRAFKKIEPPGATIGKMYLFAYDALHKDTLPFYDAFPLVFPLGFYGDGFLGINMHYLPIVARARLMNALWETMNNRKYNDSTKLQISYSILKSSASIFSRFQECVKRYLFRQINSPLSVVEILDWDKVLMLPLQRWKVNPTVTMRQGREVRLPS